MIAYRYSVESTAQQEERKHKGFQSRTNFDGGFTFSDGVEDDTPIEEMCTLDLTSSSLTTGSCR